MTGLKPKSDVNCQTLVSDQSLVDNNSVKMSLKLFLIIIFTFEAVVCEPNVETIGTIVGNILIEQNGTYLPEEPPVVTINKDFRAKLEVQNRHSLTNTSYAWFVDDVEFKAGRTPDLVYRLKWPKEYKLMAVVLANECRTNDPCSPRFGIISRKVVAVNPMSTGRAVHNLSDMWSEAAYRVKKRISDNDYEAIYNALVITGAILLVLVFVTIVLYLFNNIIHRQRSERSEQNKYLLDKQKLYDNKYRLYTMNM